MVSDFHSHVLPGIDDGSSSLEESIAMLELEAKHGVSHVVATPHFYARHDSPEQFFKRRMDAELRLREIIGKREDLPQITVGAEVYYYSGISESDILQKLTIGNTKYIMIEMPFPPWTDAMYEELRRIQMRQGLTPIVAHVDRYIGPFRTYQIPERLQELPVLVQANASFFLRRGTQHMALRMLKEDKIHLLGSDCHNMKERPPNLRPAAKKIHEKLGRDTLRRIYSYEKDILRNN